MSSSFPNAIFVAGTDTDVGKTVVSTILTLGLNGRYWKPIQSGLMPMTDTEQVKRWTELPDEHFIEETYRFIHPFSPHKASALENRVCDMRTIELPETGGGPLIIEGCGGLLVPLDADTFVIDLIKKFEIPVVLVTRTRIGTINHTLLSIEALRARNVPILGVIMNGEENEDNKMAIKEYGNVSVLGRVPVLSGYMREEFLQAFQQLEL